MMTASQDDLRVGQTDAGSEAEKIVATAIVDFLTDEITQKPRGLSYRGGPINLALSGGGFRATLFHLGVIRCLHDHDLLNKLRHVSSVSGGSILAGHLSQHWSQYNGSDRTFETAADDLITFIRSDLRGRITRRWILGTLLIFPRVLGFMTIPGTMAIALSKLYKGAELKDLKPTPTAPDFHILATSLTTGYLCRFSPDEFAWSDEKGPHQISSSKMLLSTAVACSAAFPPLFPPVPITAEILSANTKTFPYTQFLTDGGVYDNLGLEELWRISSRPSPEPCEILIVSDAGGGFDWALDQSYRTPIPRNVRAADILMDRVGKLVPHIYVSDQFDVCIIEIHREIPQQASGLVQEPETQRAVKKIRTDLDEFSLPEIHALLRQGYSAAEHFLYESRVIKERKTSTWSKVNAREIAETLVEDSSRRRRLRVCRASDPVSWLNLALILVWSAALTLVPLRSAYQAGVRRGQALIGARVRFELRGAVVDRTDQTAIRHAEVKLKCGKFEALLPTFPNGQFDLGNIPVRSGETCDLAVEAPGYLPEGRTITRDASFEVVAMSRVR